MRVPQGESILRKFIQVAAAAALSASISPAQAVTLVPDLAGMAFLVGHWTSGTGKVADTGGTARGKSTITVEAGGAVLLRRDHTDLFDAHGQASGGMDQIMMIYPDAGSVRADYSDGSHVIHYTAAQISAGHSVVFTSEGGGAAPTFRLTYELKSADTLAISFAMSPPGQSEFHDIATGTAHKDK